MKGSFEVFVRRLFGDAAFKDQAVRNPEAAMAEYRLSSAEKAAARKLCGRLVTPEGMMAFGASLWF